MPTYKYPDVPDIEADDSVVSSFNWTDYPLLNRNSALYIDPEDIQNFIDVNSNIEYGRYFFLEKRLQLVRHEGQIINRVNDHFLISSGLWTSGQALHYDSKITSFTANSLYTFTEGDTSDPEATLLELNYYFYLPSPLRYSLIRFSNANFNELSSLAELSHFQSIKEEIFQLSERINKYKIALVWNNRNDIADGKLESPPFSNTPYDSLSDAISYIDDNYINTVNTEKNAADNTIYNKMFNDMTNVFLKTGIHFREVQNFVRFLIEANRRPEAA